jgi:hypothetical protein
VAVALLASLGRRRGCREWWSQTVWSVRLGEPGGRVGAVRSLVEFCREGA